ncbi:hypothetical protein DGMP_17470 [Desulfomarina profundi]|uniref:Nucleoside phosphorylase domain-containing protein n=1 Tax=Desulfomarina profundi TaxID=2772557 RepID=A0A8D5JH59_9BACT|nr:hypothetical protein DGMP_17470 [Desulfomarina profundi]
MVRIGIIGGSGLDDPDLIENPELVSVETEFGEPSSTLLCGKIGGVETCLLARHGKKHQLSPTQVNNRANIAALKKMGVTHILATTACGSLREEIDRGIWLFLISLLILRGSGKTVFMILLKMELFILQWHDPLMKVYVELFTTRQSFLI